MSIDNNQEAVNAVRNMHRSLEIRTRSLYNYVYKDGFKDGVEVSTREIVEKIVAEKLDEDGDTE